MIAWIKSLINPPTDLGNAEWANGAKVMRLDHAACYMCDICLLNFDKSETAKETLKRLIHYAEFYQIHVEQDGWTLQRNRPYPRPNITRKTFVLKSTIEEILVGGATVWMDFEVRERTRAMQMKGPPAK